MNLKQKFFITVLLCFSATFSQACPFASYKKGRYQKKKLANLTPMANSKEVLDHFQRRYQVALSELQLQSPYGLVQSKQHVKTLESFLNHAETYAERKSIKKTASCLKLVADHAFKPHLKGRERYKHFIEVLRIAIENKNNATWKDSAMERFVAAILQRISYSHFTVNFNHTEIGYQYFWDVMPTCLAQLDPSDINAKLLNKMVNKIFPSSAPKVFLSKLNQKLHAPFFASWDGAIATLRSKFASYQWHDRNVSLLRMSSPVYGKNYRSAVDPIFVEYLNELKEKKQRHLYISNLDTSTSAHSREFKISKLMQNLSRKKEYADTFLFIILPFESSFYKQGNLGLLRAGYFKETFLNSMLLKQEGFYFPSRLLTDSKFIAFLGQMLDQIHQVSFGEREFLERIERCQFIDIAYAHIAKYLVEQNQIDMVNWACRDGVDSSMSAVAVFDVLLQSISPAPIHLESTLYISLWPAMLYHHRHPETTCTVRAYSAIQKLLQEDNRSDLAEVSTEPLNDLAL
ncbi:MAG: hypothetical protein S4CHLAM6_05540 [Chlamydiae bacterium]|nr:hypothetical protein [Chlamydiota bacterium]